MKAPRLCHKCDAPVSSQSKTGLCKEHRLALFPIRQVPEDRRVDFNYLRNTGMSPEEAVAHINAGLPVQRKGKFAAFAKGYVKVPTLKAVDIACSVLRIPAREVMEGRQFAHAVDCRAAVTEAMTRQGVSYSQIGLRLKRDHTSIMHLHRTFAERVERNPRILRAVEAILELAA